VSFVSVDFVTDSDTLADDAVDYLRAAMPGWEPADGNLEVWILQAVARQVAELTAVAADVPAAIFRQFGTQLVGLAPQAGARATLTSFWTARDNLGYTIPAGTQVAYRVTGDDLIVFEVVGDTIITPGATTLSGVALQATDVGTAWNAVPTGPLELVDALSWVESVAASAVSAGGLDAETDDAYLDRLADDLRLLTPRPILPDDFATLARNVTGVYRALAINGYDPGTDEVQQVAITGSPTGGTFTLTYSGQTTAGIAWNAAASAVQSALEALSNIAVGDVAVTGGPLPGTPVLVEFTGALASTNVAQMTTSGASLTGGSTPASAVTTVTPGVASSTGNERYLTVVPIDSAGAACSPTIRAAVVAYLDGLREVSFVVKAATPTSTTVNVAYTVKVATGYVAADVQAACDVAVTAYLSPATWGGGDATPPVWRTGEDKVRVGELYAALYAVPGVAYVSALTVNSGTSDVTLSGVAPLPAVGTITGTTI
jgi:hypothetical protein